MGCRQGSCKTRASRVSRKSHMRNRFLNSLINLVLRHPWKVVISGLFFAALSIFVSAQWLVTNNNQDDLVSSKLPYHARYLNYLEEFGDQEYIYLVVSTASGLQVAENFLEDFSKHARNIPHINEVISKMDTQELSKSALLRINYDNLDSLTKALNTPGLHVTDLAEVNDLSKIFKLINAQLVNASSATDDELPKAGFAILDNILDGMISSIGDAPYTSPFNFLQTNENNINAEGYIQTDGGKYLIAMIMPEKNYQTLEVVGPALDSLRDVLNKSRAKFPTIEAGITGRPVLAADEMRATNQDMVRAVFFALILVGLIFILRFKRLDHPALAILALCVGICWTFGTATILVGSLNLLSSVFAIVLVGTGIDFGLHIVERYREELTSGKTIHEAIQTAITSTGRANLTAAITTAAAFVCAIFTDFLALQELGIIAACGILLCLFSMLTILPALLFLRDSSQKNRIAVTPFKPMKMLDTFYSHPKVAVTCTLLICILTIPGVLRVKFDHNLLNLQARGLESIEYELKLINETNISTWQAVILTNKLSEVTEITSRLEALETVAKVESVKDLLPTEQQSKIALIKTVDRPKNLDFTNIKQINIPELHGQISKLQNSLDGFSDQALRAGRSDVFNSLTTFQNKVSIIREELISNSVTSANQLNKYQKSFFRDYRMLLDTLHQGLAASKITLKNIPQQFLNRFVSKNNQYAIYVYPKQDIWDPALMQAFVNDLRSVDPKVTGTPIEVYESSKILENGFLKVAALSVLLVLIITWLDFRSLSLTLLAALPLTFGIWLLLAIMGNLQIPFTLANFFGVPILIGLGVDNAVQILHRTREAGKFSNELMQQSVGPAVTLTSLTTMASFATLCFATHRGIQGLGLIMTIGTATILLGTIIVLPIILKLIPTYSTNSNHL